MKLVFFVVFLLIFLQIFQPHCTMEYLKKLPYISIDQHFRLLFN